MKSYRVIVNYGAWNFSKSYTKKLQAEKIYNKIEKIINDLNEADRQELAINENISQVRIPFIYGHVSLVEERRN